jgi:hypothetical protein
MVVGQQPYEIAASGISMSTQVFPDSSDIHLEKQTSVGGVAISDSPVTAEWVSVAFSELQENIYGGEVDTSVVIVKLHDYQTSSPIEIADRVLITLSRASASSHTTIVTKVSSSDDASSLEEEVVSGSCQRWDDILNHWTTEGCLTVELTVRCTCVVFLLAFLVALV